MPARKIFFVASVWFVVGYSSAAAAIDARITVKNPDESKGPDADRRQARETSKIARKPREGTRQPGVKASNRRFSGK